MTNLELINLLLCIGLIVSITKIILLEQEINELIVNIKILAFIIEKNKTNEVKKSET